MQLEQVAKEQTNITVDCLDRETDGLLGNDQSHYSIQWFHNGSLVGTADRRKLINNIGQLTINQIHSSDEGFYVCQLNHTGKLVRSNFVQLSTILFFLQKGYPLTYNAGINLKVIETLKFISLPVDRRLELNRAAKIHCKARTSIDASNLRIRWVKGDLLLKALQVPTEHDQVQEHLNLNSNLLNQLKQLVSLNRLNGSNSTNVKDDENGYLIIKQMSKQEEGFYTCLAYTNQELIYATIRLDAFVMPKFTKTPPSELTKTVHDDLQLDCSATGDPKPFVKFDKDNDPNLLLNNPRIQAFENGSLTISNLTEEDSGKYSCLVGNSGGFIRSEAYLTVKSLNSLKIDLVDTIDEANLNTRIQRTVVVALGIALLYIMVIVGLLVWFRCKRLADRKLLQNEIVQGTSSSSSSNQSGNSSSTSSNQGTKSNSLEKCSLNDHLELKGTYGLFNSDLQKTSTYLIDDHSAPNILADTNSTKSTDSFKRKNLKQIMLLGNGQFGNVFLGKAAGLNAMTNAMTNLNSSNNSNNSNSSSTEAMVMVKSLQSFDPMIVNEFNQEIEMFKKLSHNHITKLLAVCLEQEPFLMILEYSDYGDLKQYLLATRSDNASTIKAEPLTKVQLLKIAIQISNAMCYLTEQFCVHKDLAARNCLISSSLDIKVTSCSLSNDTYANDYIRFKNKNLPLRWTPSEALFDDEWTKYSDVWSFAIMFYWELIFNESPYHHLRDDEVFNQLKCKQLKLNFDEFDLFSDHLCLLLMQCLNYQPTERPSFTSLHSTLINELNFISS